MGDLAGSDILDLECLKFAKFIVDTYYANYKDLNINRESAYDLAMKKKFKNIISRIFKG